MIEEIGEDGEDGDPTEEDVLLYSHFAGPRIFVINDSSKTNITGILLDESEDSFLVGLPVKFSRETTGKEKIIIEPYIPVPYFRLMKSSVFSVMFSFDPYLALYLDYVKETGVKLYPEALEYLNVELQESNPSGIIEVGPDEDEQGVKSGMTDDELREYLFEKYNLGGLSNGSGKKQ